jgi:ABC-type Fe3+ transport system permease subunit
VAEFAPYSQWQHVFSVLREVSAGKIDDVSEKTFAFALSSGICQVAIAFAFAFFVSHVFFLELPYAKPREALGPLMIPVPSH